MNNADYWKQRFTQLETAQHRKGATAYLEMERQYKEAQRQLEGQIARWYQRFADNNGISLAQAKQWLKGDDLAEFKWDVKAYIQHGKENAINGAWMQELENASAKYHISKLEVLKIQTQNSLETMFAKQFGTMKKTLSDVYATGYYHTAYEVQRGFKIGWDIAGLDQAQIEKVLAKPWAVDGYNFSERIWGNKTKLISEVHNELSQNIMLGADPQKAIDSLAKKMNTSKNNAGRLVMTEEAYFSSAAQKDCFKSLDVEQYEIVATLDSHTSDICRNLDGKHFPMKDYQPGVTAPPFHVGCRSTTVPYFDEQFDIGERAARGADGKTYYVPENTIFEEWKKAVVHEENSFTTRKKNGIIKKQGGDNLSMWIDKFTPCLEDCETGQILDTVYSLATKKELKYLKGWNFNWAAKDLSDCKIYKITLAGQEEIQGLIALTSQPSETAVYVNLAESAPHNLGSDKKYHGVGGHLFAIAANESIKMGFGGFFYMDAKNMELVEHYRKTLGALWIGMPHPYRMLVDEESAQKLLEIYNFKED